MLAFYHLYHLSYLRTYDPIAPSVPLPPSRLLSGSGSVPLVEAETVFLAEEPAHQSAKSLTQQPKENFSTHICDGP